jgi:hypothetical protein
MFAAQIREAVAAAPRAKLPELTALLWRAFGAGQVTEAEAEVLSQLIELRTVPQTPVGSPRTAVGSRPRTDASMERRRRWAASGRLPPQIACRFTLAEQAVLAVVAAETVKRGDCRLYHEHLAALAGVAKSTVRATLRRARALGFVSIEERRSSAWRNLSSIVRIVAREWQAWNRLARRSVGPGGGAISPLSTSTRDPNKTRQRPSAPSQKLPERQGRARAAAPRDSGAGPSRASLVMRS